MNCWSLYLACTALTRKRNARFAHLAYTQQTVRVQSQMGIPSLTLGAALFHENDGFVEEYITIKTHRRKICAAMECESVEISGFLQVRFVEL